MACDIWNSKVLKPPLRKTYQSKAHDIDFANVQSLLSDAVQTHKIDNTLLVESCIMRKVIYRLKLQFRHDKGFKFFEATNRFLNHFFENNISKDLRYFLSFIPRKYEKVVSLPCKQMLEYLLVRLQGYAQVCARIVESSFKCINFMKTRLLLGHQWEIALVAISIASRIWFICRHYAIKCCLLYNNLLPLLEKLTITGEKWLPDSYEFPTDLTTWLNYDWLIEIPDIIIQLPVGIPNFVLDDDDVEFIGQYNQTYIIPDDSDDDNTNDVKFVCQLNDKKLKLNKKQVKHLQSRLVINLDDSGSNDDQVVPSKFDDIFELLDDDIQIIESKSDDVVAIDDKIDENSNIGDFNAKIGQEITQDTVEDQNDDTGESIDEDIAIISDSEEENEMDKDIGEPITRQQIEEEQGETHDNNEKQEENEEDEVKLDDNEEEQENEESEEEEIEDNKEEQMEEEDEEYLSLLSELEETQKCIKIYDYLQKLDTIEKLIIFLQNENLKRKTDKHNQCLFVNIPDKIWYHIAFHIKYFIAMTVANLQNRNKYLIKSRNVLLSIALEKNISAFIPTLKNEKKSVDDYVPMTLKGIEYLINSIDTLSDLQLFIAKEIHKREKSVQKCLFSNYNSSEWTQIYNKLKYLIVMGMKRPLRSNVYLRKAKDKLTQLLLNKNDDSESSSDSDFEELTQKNNFDNMYRYVTRRDSHIELFNYIQDIEDYICPSNMKNILRERIKKNLENLNAHVHDANGNSINKRANNSSPQSYKKNDNILIEQPRKLTINQKKRKIAKEKKLENLNANKTKNYSPQSCKINDNLLIEQPRKLTRKQKKRKIVKEKKIENLNANEDCPSPNKKRKLTNNFSPLSCKKDDNLLIEQPLKLTRNQKRRKTVKEKKLENLNANKTKNRIKNSSPQSCKKIDSLLIEQPRKLTRNQKKIQTAKEKKFENLSAHEDSRSPNKKRKRTNKSSPQSSKKNRNVQIEQPRKLTRSPKDRKAKKKRKLN